MNRTAENSLNSDTTVNKYQSEIIRMVLDMENSLYLCRIFHYVLSKYERSVKGGVVHE